MKQVTWLIGFMAIGCMTGYGQVGKKGSINASTGVEILFPNSTLRNTHNIGGGVNVKGEYVFARHASVTVSAGYNYLNGKKVNGLKQEDIRSIPVKAGLRYYLGNFYAGAETGALFEQGFDAGRGIIFAVAMGDEIITQTNGNSLDISLRYERWGTRVYSSIVGLRVAYEFRLK
jgi:hypothetical protein